MQPRNYLWLECLVAFGGLPLVIYFTRERGIMIAILWLGAFFAWQALKRDHPALTFRAEWNVAGFKAGAKNVVLRVLLLAPVLFLFTYFHDYDRLFSFPRDRTMLWAMVMVLYPVLSVVPQEILFRTYFIKRYAPLFHARVLSVSAIAFGYAHLPFRNWIAIVFCLCGGLMFADTYRKYRSLALVCLEHALYGCLIFTLGLGWYFYGSAWTNR